MLNGKLLPDVIGDAAVLTSIPVAAKRVHGAAITLPPISVSFVAIGELPLPAGCSSGGGVV